MKKNGNGNNIITVAGDADVAAAHRIVELFVQEGDLVKGDFRRMLPSLMNNSGDCAVLILMEAAASKARPSASRQHLIEMANHLLPEDDPDVYPSDAKEALKLYASNFGDRGLAWTYHTRWRNLHRHEKDLLGQLAFLGEADFSERRWTHRKSQSQMTQYVTSLPPPSTSMTHR